ncbi:MAG: hypothetical protein AAFQ63_00035 [Cyanobacteria bacterium J06621_11]
MANQLQQLKSWLLEQRNFRVAWFARDAKQKAAPQEALCELPDEIAQQLVAAANNLPIHPCDQAAVISALDEAITKWRERPHAADNSIVILCDPVSSISRILAESLDMLRCQKEEETLPISLLNWVERPTKVKSIKRKIRDKLGLPEGDYHQKKENRSEDSDSFSEAQPDKPQSEKNQSKKNQSDKTLMVIPNLSWCFLRSADGLDGLDYLQNLLPHNRAQFWILGSGRVGWDYLKSTIRFNAYCGETMVLPFLSGKDLQEWMEPIVQQFDIEFSDAALHKRLEKQKNLIDLETAIEHPVETVSEVSQEVSATLKSSIRATKEEILEDFISDEPDEEERSAKQDYFDRLSSISDGVSTTALQLFIKSLRYQESTDENADSAEESSSCVDDSQPPSQLALIASVPKLPALPDLSQNDLYLLYSLIMHGDLTIKALAESLGDAPNIVNNQVQILRGLGVIEQKGNVLKANPAYYPRIRRELARNNFVIEVP